MTKGFAPKLIPSLLLAAFAGTASAGGFQLFEQSASGLGNAYAGSAANAENASTIFYNPAGMTQLQGVQVSAGVDFVRPSYRFQNNGSTVPSTQGVPHVGTLPVNQLSGDGADGGRLGTLPNGYFSLPIGKDLFFGIGFGAPFGLMTDYTNSWLGAAESIQFKVETYNINPSLAYKVNDKVSIGGGLNWQQLNINYSKLAFGWTSMPALSTSSPMANLSASDSSWGWNLGALFTLSDSTKVGVSYRSDVKFNLNGQLNVGTSALTSGGQSLPAGANITLPDTFILSVAQKLSDRWELLGDVSRTGWAKIPKVDIVNSSTGSTLQTLNTDFRNTWRAALGANYLVSSSTKLKFGVAYDQTPVKGADTRLVSLPDNNRVWFSTGVQWVPAKGSTIDVGAAYLYVRDAQIHASTVDSGGGLNVVNGTFKDNAWILGAQYSMAF